MAGRLDPNPTPAWARVTKRIVVGGACADPELASAAAAVPAATSRADRAARVKHSPAEHACSSVGCVRSEGTGAGRAISSGARRISTSTGRPTFSGLTSVCEADEKAGARDTLKDVRYLPRGERLDRLLAGALIILGQVELWVGGTTTGPKLLTVPLVLVITEFRRRAQEMAPCGGRARAGVQRPHLPARR